MTETEPAGKGMGVELIGIGPKPKGDSESYAEEPAEEEGAASEAKMTAARALMSALKASDAEAFSTALDAYLEC